MRVRALALADYRSYPSVDLEFPAGVSLLLGPNGQGKTNLVEAVGYLATHSSHRAATSAPLVRSGAQRAVLRAAVVRGDRELVLELELNPGRASRARVNRAPVPRPREALGLLRTVLFAPEDLALVKGDPGERRRFLDDLLVARQPRFAAVRADYERVLRQRTTLLKSAGAARRGGDLATLDVWDGHLARFGAELTAARLDLVESLRPLVDKAYAAISATGSAACEYRPSWTLDNAAGRADLTDGLLTELSRVRQQEIDRGVCLVGPHRDDLQLAVGDLPARGYASHGESWSLALALRLASFDLLRADGGPGADPVLVLDDVFAELDARRRERLAELVLPAEQVLVTAAVAADVPAQLGAAATYEVSLGTARRAG